MSLRLRLALVVLAGAFAVAPAPATATIYKRTMWDVGLTAKRTEKWTFTGQRPDRCAEYLGTERLQADGNGTQTLSAATTARRRISAETYRLGSRFQFSSFSTDGWSVPSTITKTGTASTQQGRPCDADPTAPEPLPVFASTKGCGSKTGTTSPTLAWTRGKLTVELGSGPPEPASWITCPDTAEPGLHIGRDAECGPRRPAPIAVSALKFLLRKKFTVEAAPRYVCPIPDPEWLVHGTATLAREVSFSYALTFTPRKP